MPVVNAPHSTDNAQQRLIAAIQDGLPLSARPYADIGARIGLSEEDVIARIAAMQQQGTIKRLGVVVRHHELGYRANAMVVWDVPMNASPHSAAAWADSISSRCAIAGRAACRTGPTICSA